MTDAPSPRCSSGTTEPTNLPCDHLWGTDSGRGSGSTAVVACEKCGALRKASDSPAWRNGPPFETKEDADEAADNGQNTGGKSYV